MGNLFDKQVSKDGLSRSKIIWFGVTVSLVVVVLVLYGVFSTDNVPESKEIPFTQSSNRETDILSKIKQINSSAVVNNSTNITTPKLLNNSTESLVKVPPIVDDEELQFKRQLRQSKQKNLLKQTDSQYTAISSKTLMFSSIAKNNTSGGVVAPAPSSPNNNESGGIYAKAYYKTETILPRSPYELKAGSVIPSTMINGINSDLPGEVIAFVRDNVYDSVSRQYLLIPQGSRLVGLYDSNIAYGQQRVAVAWNRLIYPDGSSIDLKATPGTDIAGFSGFYDQVDNKYWQIFGASFIMGVITAGMQYSQNNTNANVQSGGVGYTNPNPSVGQTLSGSLGQQMGQTGLAVTQKNLNVAPTLIIRQGYQFNIMLTADLILRPYGV